MPDDTSMSQTRARNLRDGLKVTWVGMAVNVILVVLKLSAGIFARSQALIADGVHSISDLVSDIIVIVGLRWGRQEEDEDHPFGHARIETVSSMLIGIILILVALGLAWNAIGSLYEHHKSTPGIAAIVAAAVSILLKEAMYWYTVKVGWRIKSPALIGNAWHHRSDALSSVAVLIGVAGAYLNPSWHLADSFAALIVTYFIAKMGVGLAWTAIKEIVDTAPDRKTLEEIRRTGYGIEGVRQVHDVRARYSGAQVLVEMHIVVDPELTVREGHAIARKVKRTLLSDIADVSQVIIHVDPEFKYD